MGFGNMVERVKDPAAVSLGRRGGLKGGKARMAGLSTEQKTMLGRKAAAARWKKHVGRLHNLFVSPIGISFIEKSPFFRRIRLMCRRVKAVCLVCKGLYTVNRNGRLRAHPCSPFASDRTQPCERCGVDVRLNADLSLRRHTCLFPSSCTLRLHKAPRHYCPDQTDMENVRRLYGEGLDTDEISALVRANPRLVHSWGKRFYPERFEKNMPISTDNEVEAEEKTAEPEKTEEPMKDPHPLSEVRRKKGKERWERMTPEERSEFSRAGGIARWAGHEKGSPVVEKKSRSRTAKDEYRLLAENLFRQGKTTWEVAAWTGKSTQLVTAWRRMWQQEQETLEK